MAEPLAARPLPSYEDLKDPERYRPLAGIDHTDPAAFISAEVRAARWPLGLFAAIQVGCLVLAGWGMFISNDLIGDLLKLAIGFLAGSLLGPAMATLVEAGLLLLMGARKVRIAIVNGAYLHCYADGHVFTGDRLAVTCLLVFAIPFAAVLAVGARVPGWLTFVGSFAGAHTLACLALFAILNLLSRSPAQTYVVDASAGGKTEFFLPRETFEG